jgi:predicted RNA binding protein YcfA (HicA-like mRNA interferase family)
MDGVEEAVRLLVDVDGWRQRGEKGSHERRK